MKRIDKNETGFCNSIKKNYVSKYCCSDALFESLESNINLYKKDYYPRDIQHLKDIVKILDHFNEELLKKKWEESLLLQSSIRNCTQDRSSQKLLEDY